MMRVILTYDHHINGITNPIFQVHKNQSVYITKNFVDSWIDELNPKTVNNGNEHRTQNQNIQLSWLMQQSLP